MADTEPATTTCRPYYCPAAGDTECCPEHSGWDVCCDRPELHIPLDTLAARLREIADDPSWSGVYRMEAKDVAHDRIHELSPVSLSDDDIREALRARILAWSEANRRAPKGPCDGPALFAKVNELRASLGHPVLPPERPCDLVCQHVATP